MHQTKVRQLSLLHGEICLVDDDDFALVSGFKWRATAGKTKYAVTTDKTNRKKIILMHRLILGLLSNPLLVTDHIDGNGLNNTRANLRACTQAQNVRNSVIRCDNESGIRNVMLHSNGRGEMRFRGIVTINGIKHRKWFNNSIDAEKWCAEKRIEVHGEFAFDKRPST